MQNEDDQTNASSAIATAKLLDLGSEQLLRHFKVFGHIAVQQGQVLAEKLADFVRFPLRNAADLLVA